MILSALKDFLVGFIGKVGYIGVFIAMVIESCLIPLPSEITMPLAGALAAEGEMNVHIASFVGAIANVVGSLIAYYIGMKIPEKVILKFLEKWGRFFLLSVHEYETVKGWLHKYGSWVSFGSRLLPGVRTVISLPAGVARIKIIPFIVYTFIGSLIWSYFLVIIGYQLGAHWENIEVYFHKFQWAIIITCLLGAGYYIYRKILKKR